jgi:hypothetical protein
LAKSLREYVKTGAGIFSRLFFIEKTKKVDNDCCPLQKGGILESLIIKGLTDFLFFIRKKNKKFFS